MMRDSAPPIVERPGLEDVAEEEDVFAAEVSAKCALQPGSCQVGVCRCMWVCELVYKTVLPSVDLQIANSL